MPSPISDTPEVPAWMDAAFLARAVRSAGLDGVVVSTDIHSAGGKGDSYASTMLRVLAHLDTGKDISMIVKFPPPEGTTGACDMRSAFDQEASIYTKILPRMMDVLKRTGRNHDQIGPKLYLYETDPEPVLVMEDLVASGYSVSDRLRGLCWDEMLVAVRKMAVFHAASVVLHDEEPDLLSGYFMMVSKENLEVLEKQFVVGLVRFITEVESWNDELSKSVVPKLKALSDNYLQRILSLGLNFKDEDGVFMHGDLWTTNMLFKTDSSGKAQEVRFIDYQLSGWAARGAEFQYFFTVAPDSKVRQDPGRRRLLAAYHQELAACLRDLGHPEHRIPTLQYLEAEHDRTTILEVAFLTASVPVAIAPGDLGLDFMNALLDVYDGPPPHPRARALAQPAYRAVARAALQGWEEDGLLDRLVREGEEERQRTCS